MFHSSHRRQLKQNHVNARNELLIAIENLTNLINVDLDNYHTNYQRGALIEDLAKSYADLGRYA